MFEHTGIGSLATSDSSRASRAGCLDIVDATAAP